MYEFGPLLMLCRGSKNQGWLLTVHTVYFVETVLLNSS